MATIGDLQARVDNWIAVNADSIQALQDGYLLANGRFWQGLRSHSSEPSHSDSSDDTRLADNLDSSPTDQSESWSDFIPAFAVVNFDAAITVDVYDGPAGQGFVVTLEFRHKGTLYRLALNSGPETWRDQDWAVVDETLG